MFHSLNFLYLKITWIFEVDELIHCIRLATKCLRTLSIPPNDKIYNHLVANPIVTAVLTAVIVIAVYDVKTSEEASYIWFCNPVTGNSTSPWKMYRLYHSLTGVHAPGRVQPSRSNRQTQSQHFFTYREYSTFLLFSFCLLLTCVTYFFSSTVIHSSSLTVCEFF